MAYYLLTVFKSELVPSDKDFSVIVNVSSLKLFLQRS